MIHTHIYIYACAKCQLLSLGTVNNADFQSNPIHADGHSNITSPALPLQFNLNPLVIIGLITTRASEKGVDLGPLPGLFQIVTSNPNSHPAVRFELCFNRAKKLIVSIQRSIHLLIQTRLRVSGMSFFLFLFLNVLGVELDWCPSGKQFDVNDAILNALAGLEVTLKTDTVVKLDDFQTELTFSQFNVPAIVCFSYFLSLSMGLILISFESYRRTRPHFS